MRCDSDNSFSICIVWRFQSTHLHEVWLCNVIKKHYHYVSIHTPTWGVTPCLPFLYVGQKVSIHTPTWGVTWWSSKRGRFTCRFNPHTYMRCDAWARLSAPFRFRFNPHTYMRCDITSLIEYLTMISFNPHTYMRCDPINQWVILHRCVSIHTPTWGVTYGKLSITPGFQFQSTHLHEVWPTGLTTLDRVLSFNPHTYMRCDSVESVSVDPVFVSIHTPTWGVTTGAVVTRCNIEVSIHTPTWGVTSCATRRTLPAIPGFNPHTYMRCDFCWHSLGV